MGQANSTCVGITCAPPVLNVDKALNITFFDSRMWAFAVVLTCTAALSSEASGLIVNAKEINDLVGPVRQTITKDSYSTTVETFDRSGNLIEMVFDLTYDKNEHRSHSVFTYDDRNLLKEELGYADNGILFYRKFFRYSFYENGKPAAMVAAMADGSYAHSEFWIYDDRDALTAIIHFTGGNFVSKSLYDVQGKVVYAIRSRGTKVLFESVEHYNTKGELIESLSYAENGSLVRKDQYTYDEASRQIEESSEFYNDFAGQRKAVSKYKLDASGNWVSKTVQEWARGADITKPAPTQFSQERIINYYD